MTRRARGEGTIYKAKSGYWRGAVRLPSGKRVWRTATTKSEVARKLDEIRHGGASSSMTFGDFLKRWLDHIKPKVRANTYIGYAAIIENHLAPLATRRLSSLTTEHVDALLVSIERSPRTIASIRTVGSMAIEIARKWRLVSVNAFADSESPKKQKTAAAPFTNDEAIAFLIAAENWKDRALMLLAASTGARRGELLGCKWSDFDGSSWTVSRTLIRVQGKLMEFPPKSHAGYRKLPLPDRVREALKDHRRAQLEMRMAAGPTWQDNDYVFTGAKGQPLQPEYVYDSFLALLEAAKLPKRRFHDLRHTVCSLLLAQGTSVKAVQQFMGHATATVTLEIYAHLYPDLAAKSPMDY